jgi:microcin C transport system permease protein
MTLCAEIVCYHKPFFVSCEGRLYFPYFITYSDSDFGGTLPTEVDYKDPYTQDYIISKGGWMVWAPVRYRYDTVNLERSAPSPPSFENPLGTDDQGRDVLARLMYGFRLSLSFGLILMACSALLAIAAGAFQGYFGGGVDLLMQRFIELWSGLPVLFLLIVLSSFVRPTLWWLLGIMLLFSWMGLSSIVRAEFLKVRQYDYVKAAQVLGVPSFRIIVRHMLPNAMVATLTYLPFLLNHSIAMLTSLDFLGLGLPPGSPSLGELLQQGKNNLHAPWLGISAFLSISMVLMLITFIGEGLRNAFDPRSEG